MHRLSSTACQENSIVGNISRLGSPEYAQEPMQYALASSQGLNLKAALRKLRRSGSAIMTTYYGFLWTVSLLNILRVFVQIAQTEASHPTLWNWLWIITRFGAQGSRVSTEGLELFLMIFSNSRVLGQ